MPVDSVWPETVTESRREMKRNTESSVLNLTSFQLTRLDRRRALTPTVWLNRKRLQLRINAPINPLPSLLKTLRSLPSILRISQPQP